MRTLQQTKALELMDQGVQLMDPERIDVRGNLTVGRGVSIDLNSIFNGEITIGDDVTIGPNCVITDSQIGTGSVIKANSVLEQTIVGNHCSVGPFARLRPGSELADQVAVGNFVEIKKSKLGKGSKASHLTYLGDSSIGAGVNIGAGTITCNYDGENKYQTHIGEGAFIGSNSSLVAPLNIGAGATIGAGSTITKDVDDNALVLGRGKQKSIANWQRPTNKK
jgi:bifunctional UDP-N-acetylglucosamine pyrophosphorylase/glucosamine-1-phosphate N-acetyltransferase